MSPQAQDELGQRSSLEGTGAGAAFKLPHGCLWEEAPGSLLLTCSEASLQQSKHERGASGNVESIDLRSNIRHFGYVRLFKEQVIRSGPQREANTRRQESSGAILEAAFCK